MSSEFLTEKEKKTLEVDLRRQIYQLIRAHPGLHFREIERKSKLATGTVQYHLDYLCKHGLLKREHHRYFSKDFSSENKHLMGLLRQRSLRLIILSLIEHSNPNHERIVDYVKLSPSTVTWHLKKLEQEQIIQSKRKGRKTFYTLTAPKEEIVKLLISYQESFFDSVVDNIVQMWDVR